MAVSAGAGLRDGRPGTVAGMVLAGTRDRADVVIVGCGAAGLAAARELSTRGRRVVGLDQFPHGHSRGSSHGTERIVRMAYTDPVHVRMAMESVVGWRRLEADSGHTLLTATGGIDAGSATELDLLERECTAAGLTMERMTAREATARFSSGGAPWFRFDSEVVFHDLASTVNAEQALIAMREVAIASGAEIRADDPVHDLERLDSGEVVVHHRHGATRATTCVITAGAWGGSTWIGDALGPDTILPPMRVTQEQVGFFGFRDAPNPGRPFPTFIFRDDPSTYGLPTPDGLLKVGEHHTGREIDPDHPSATLDPATWERLLAWVSGRLPAVDPRPVSSATCLYAGFPDDMFVLDRAGPIVIGLGFSGHGFKFAPEVGRRLADLADGVPWPGNPFAFDRPALDVGTSGHR